MFNQDYVTLELYPTYKCNCKCSYCRVEKSDKTVSKEDFTRFFDTALQYFHRNSLKALNFVLLGGEPLLVFDNYKDVISRYKNYFPNFQFTIVTNLTILPNEILLWLKDNQVKITVSLDDLEYSKPFCNGEDTAPTVLRNIIKLQEMDIHFDICSVVDSTKIKTLIPFANYISSLDDKVHWLVNTDGYNNDLQQAECEIEIIKGCIDHLAEKHFNFQRFVLNFTGRYSDIDKESRRSLIVKADFKTVSHQWKQDKPYKCNFFNKDVFSLVGNKAGNSCFTQRNYPIECLKCNVFKYCNAASTASHSDSGIPKGLCKVNKEILNYLDSTIKPYYFNNYHSN